MANSIKSDSPKSNKISKSLIAAFIGWGLIATALVAGTGFYAGYQYKATQEAKTKAAVQDALKAVQTPAPVAQASK
jgi:hypothetical protein